MCDVFVLPSYYREGVPRATLEAMAIGCAVVTCDSVGCRTTVKIVGERTEGPVIEGLNGFLIAPRSVESLEEAMLRLVDNPDIIQRMAITSREFAEELFDVSKINASMLSFISDCRKNRTAA
jgi:glycosyltransferase involved in cell wall biosynthesis